MTLRKNLQMMLTVVLLVLAAISLHWQERLLEKTNTTTSAEEVEPLVHHTEKRQSIACLQHLEEALPQNSTYNTRSL